VAIGLDFIAKGLEEDLKKEEAENEVVPTVKKDVPENTQVQPAKSETFESHDGKRSVFSTPKSVAKTEAFFTPSAYLVSERPDFEMDEYDDGDDDNDLIAMAAEPSSSMLNATPSSTTVSKGMSSPSPLSKTPATALEPSDSTMSGKTTFVINKTGSARIQAPSTPMITRHMAKILEFARDRKEKEEKGLF
jgi:hypothetical protein